MLIYALIWLFSYRQKNIKYSNKYDHGVQIFCLSTGIGLITLIALVSLIKAANFIAIEPIFDSATQINLIPFVVSLGFCDLLIFAVDICNSFCNNSPLQLTNIASLWLDTETSPGD